MINRMVKGCLFDLDGVLVDTARFHYLAWKRLAKELRFDFEEVDNELLKGVSRMASLDILLDIGRIKATPERKEIFANKKNDWFVEYIMQMTPEDVLPGVTQFLEKVHHAGILMGLGSASKNAMTILERTALVKWFDAVIDGTRIKEAKPDPEVFLQGAKALGLPPDTCVVFEDAIAGIKAAHYAGMRCIGVGDPRILHKADRVIPGFVGLELDILKFEQDSV